MLKKCRSQKFCLQPIERYETKSLSKSVSELYKNLKNLLTHHIMWSNLLDLTEFLEMKYWSDQKCIVRVARLEKNRAQRRQISYQKNQFLCKNNVE